jgi:plastocyanin
LILLLWQHSPEKQLLAAFLVYYSSVLSSAQRIIYYLRQNLYISIINLFLLLMLLSIRILFAAAITISALSANASTHTVSVGNNFYSPANLSINVGDQVYFVWATGSHPTMSDSSPAAFAPFSMDINNRIRIITFNTVGTFPYHCMSHAYYSSGSNSYVGQVGTIVVNAIIPTSINSGVLSATLKIYPNPSRGLVTVRFDQETGQDYKLRLNNIIGEEIRTVALKPELTAAGLPLDLSDLPAGMYFYTLLADDKVVATKRLVLHN